MKELKHIDIELVLPMYNTHPYFSLKNVGKNAHTRHSKMWFYLTLIRAATIFKKQKENKCW